VRNIVKIDESKCNGCGLCVTACAENAIKIINGKAKLVSETYCDGLGACIGHCPQGAITIEKRDAADFDENAVKAHLAATNKPVAPEKLNFVCPGMMAKQMKKSGAPVDSGPMPSQLTHWPVQLKLLSPTAPCFADADLLLTADCVPFAMGDFHSRFLKDHTVAVGCPKLDDVQFYIDKLAQILKANKIKSLTVIHMEVPCCSGLTFIAKKAIEQTQVNLSFTDITISLDGFVKNTEIVQPNLALTD
jgi:NAD-dependent dihydropyrimidine dehydrogenase PreA subunit